MADRLTNLCPCSRISPSTPPASPGRRHRRRGVLDRINRRLTSELLGCFAYASWIGKKDNQFKQHAASRSMQFAGVALQFRAEFFNTLNHTNFGPPNPIVFAGTSISPSAGLITTTATTSRQIQLGLKVIY